MNYHSKYPFLKLLLFLASGIYAGYQFTDNKNLFFSHFSVLLVLISLFLLQVIFYYVNVKFYRLFRFGGVITALFLILTGFFAVNILLPQKVEKSEAASVIGELSSVTISDSSYVRGEFKPLYFDDVFLKDLSSLLIVIYGEGASTLNKGDVISVKGTVTPLSEAENPAEFDYGRYLWRSGFSGELYARSYNVAVVADSRFQRESTLSSSRLREYFIGNLKRAGCSDSAMMLVRAVLLGDRSKIDRDIRDGFIKSGAIHLLAVSGLHVGVIYLFVNFLTSLLFKRRRVLRLLLVISTLVFYALIAGFSPSVTRAVIMFAVIQTGVTFNRDIVWGNILSAAAFISLLVNPLFLFHVGFWLSYAAVGGIVLLYPYFKSLLPFKFVVFKMIWSIVSVSLAAQIFTLPLSLYVFEAFPLYFLLSSLFVLPVVAPFLIFSMLTLIFSFSPVLSLIFVGVVNDLAAYMLQMVAYIEALPGAYVTGIWVSFPLFIALFYTIISSCKLYFSYSGGSVVKTALGVVVVLAVINFQYYNKISKNLMVLYSCGNREFMADFCSGGKLFHFASSNIEDGTKSYIRDSFVKTIKAGEQTDFIFDSECESKVLLSDIYFNGDRYIILYGHLTEGYLIEGERERCDYLILAGDFDLSPDKLISNFLTDKVIASTFVSYETSFELQSYLKKRDIDFYDIRLNGAYVNYY
ncbi:ComEC/Rec2 family competence protein [Marinilabiliaceae bacterium ANBcel2]|nr:ComEC/Rec2 family competence protein [Marinilabiliaceae bacterium ANBcel2]